MYKKWRDIYLYVMLLCLCSQVLSHYLSLEDIHAIVGLREFFRYSRIAKENTWYRLCDLGEHNGRRN